MNIPLLIVILYVLLLFGISIYVSYSQKKDSENFLLYLSLIHISEPTRPY